MEIFYKLERVANKLEVEKYKLNLPQHFNLNDVNSEINKLSQEVNTLTNQLNQLTGLEMKKDLMCMQITEYLKEFKKNTPLAFSKSQGYIGNHFFYTKPFTDIKNILFNDFRGIMGVHLFLTNKNSDAVTDLENFKNLLLEIRTDIINSNSMSDLFKVCEKFIEKIKKEFN
ncbi:hypothetical protein [uncultured Chryseobacterium sp.]|uniref:hypothetical protein n=1 Tax=uncultured Chryseobacterium sp. TaxID=259322 RepID=UPI002582C31F|nr:hypothetical protein [uncultured Chryseobacterium sp.]